MTYRELKAKIDSLDDSQLDQTVEYQEDGHCGFVVELFVAEDDYINPSGDGAEPIGEYRKSAMEPEWGLFKNKKDMEEHLKHERILFEKGTVFLIGDQPQTF